MRMFKFYLCLFWSLILIGSSRAQDPSYSQFFSSPLNINPALTANINGDWRVISNIRSQWTGPASPFTTGTISYDTKLLKDNLPDNSTLGIGAMLMYDKVMEGAIKSNYASVNATYNLQFAESEYGGIHRVGLGIGGIYGHRRVNYGLLNFGEQFNGSGFDTNLPTGEASLSQMKPYFSTSVGMLYSYTSESFNIDMGVSGFHVNKPKQSFLEDKNNILPVRYTAHANFEMFLNEDLMLNANAIYQKQSSTSYFSVGGALGYYLSKDENIVVNAGMWYWSNNALVPYVGFGYNNFQLGITYDYTISKLAAASQRPNTWEISFILRGSKEKTKGIIHCPWK